METKLSFGKSLLIIGFLLTSIFIGVILWELDPQIPILFTTVIAIVISLIDGVKWEDLQKAMFEAINSITPSVVFLLVMGIMLGTWLHSGVVPTIIYYGSKIISPKIFLPTAFLLASATSVTTGDSWGTAGTIGVALLGIAISFGLPAPIIAGAIVSGSYFGDKLSPISDTTVLAAGTVGVNVFDHVKYMLYTTVPSMIIAMIAYYIIGIKYSTNVDIGQIDQINTLLRETFTITPFLLLVPLSVIVMIAMKIDPIPALMISALIAGLFSILLQGASVAEVIDVMHYGVELDTGSEIIDGLIAGGGLDYVMWTISLILCVMAFAGVLDASGATEAIVNKILMVVRSTGDLILATVVSSIFVNIVTADQYLAIIFPGRMFKDTYKEKNIDLRVLSRTLEDAGTLTSPLIPWNTCGAFISGVLGVSAFAYLPYAILNWLNPIIAVIYGYTNFNIAYTDGVEEVLQEAGEMVEEEE